MSKQNAIIKLKPDIKQRWVEALRSKKYKQGRERLLDEDDNYCCLGVLGDLAVEDNVCSWEDYGYLDDGSGESSYLALPRFIADWACSPEDALYLKTENPSEEDAFSFLVYFEGVAPRRLTSLDTLNDRGITFEEIADLIEAQL